MLVRLLLAAVVLASPRTAFERLAAAISKDVGEPVKVRVESVAGDRVEFDVVFLPRLEAGELPSRLARGDDERAEERRLLYVGMTRARQCLALTWSRRPSAFLAELAGEAERRGAAAGAATAIAAADGPLYAALAAWRGRRAKVERVPAFRVFHNRVLAAIAGARPTTREELAEVSGVGPAKLDRYGDEVLEVVAAA